MSTSLIDEPLYPLPEQVFRRKVNVAGKERVFSAVGGGALLLYGLGRRSLPGFALAALGGALVARGATGNCQLYRTLGVDTAHVVEERASAARKATGLSAVFRGERVMSRTQRSITISRPLEEVYLFLRNLSNLPRFMDELKAVHDLGDGRYRFVLKGPRGSTIEQDVAIAEDVENRKIVWRAIAPGRGAPSGEVTLATAPLGRGTEVALVLQTESVGGLLGHIATTLRGGGPAVMPRGDLRRLRQLLETGETATAEGPHGRRTWR
ncbi:cyclase/dehydrase [Sorangium cellulosum]|uniref:Cyclase/dehydrase n=1 Tax=Sorangium cellulosum TaxID=56 RepID=A0A2L0EU06_SORCE|nr:YgaP-like transmembrane domain [Sorangium cellulosum]AUX42764.1 cyclase/dehydrase [Sorangium cellulosum]